MKHSSFKEIRREGSRRGSRPQPLDPEDTEAFQAAVEAARTRSNPEVTPDHLLSPCSARRAR